MSQSDDDGSSGLKAFAFTVGVTVLIFLILYAAKHYNPGLFAQRSFAQSHSWYYRSEAVPPVTIPDRTRRSLGEKPRIWDVWIASWYPRSRRAGDGEKNADWAGFLPLSVGKILDTSPILPQTKSSYPAPSTHVQIGTIILMPAPPQPSTPSPNLNTYGPPREYVLGTSHHLYATDD